jgi:hypothetical protein
VNQIVESSQQKEPPVYLKEARHRKQNMGTAHRFLGRGPAGGVGVLPKDSHVGIVGGWDESGNVQIIHCASGHNNVVITGKAGFATVGRPGDYGE